MKALDLVVYGLVCTVFSFSSLLGNDNDSESQVNGSPIDPYSTGAIATAPTRSSLSSAVASRVIIARDSGPIPINANANFPFGEDAFGAVLAQQGIVYDSSNDVFTFSHTGLYLVSYGFVLDPSTPDAFVSLFLNNTQIIGSEIYNHEPQDMSNATIVVTISDLSQTLSLGNSSSGTLFLMQNSFSQLPLNPPMAAYITITRITDL